MSIQDTLGTDATTFTLNNNSTNYYAVSAFDVYGNESSLTPWVSYINGQLNITQDWQLVSNPGTKKKNISGAQVFNFQGSYREDSVLIAGQGYWIKSEAGQAITLQDQGIDSAVMLSS